MITKDPHLLSSYDFTLPEELIAVRPAPRRSDSRLLVYDLKKDSVTHAHFHDIGNYLPPRSTLVLNQSKVFPCRLFGRKKSGGICEIFLLSLKGDGGIYPALIQARGRKRIGDEYYLEGENLRIVLIQIINGQFWIKPDCNHSDFLFFLDRYAKIPIPPYIRKGEGDEQDKKDYQTVFARHIGSVAAPTAGLHFTNELMEKLISLQYDFTKVTLHVGLGTFAPIKTTNILDHKMHSEIYQIEEMDMEKIKSNYGELIAVGTTSLRVLESLSMDKSFSFTECSTDIFLHPGKEIKSIKGLVTNFHLPKSSLLILVSTLIGRERTLELYNLAIKEKYRFFSYGDAMLLLV